LLLVSIRKQYKDFTLQDKGLWSFDAFKRRIQMQLQDSSQREEILFAARAFARLGYMHGFGHISIRTADGVLITPTRPPFLEQQPADVLRCDGNGQVQSGNAKGRPIEVFLHLGIYAARKDVHAICRTHAPHSSAVQSQQSVPPIRHGFGGIAETIAVHNETDLIHNLEMGRRAAETLGTRDALIIRGNGALTVGATVGQAAARMWSVEERCSFDKLTPDHAMSFSREELAARKNWYEAESERIWTWLQHLAKR
jgi:HCOMODA/2-hydroxy-3-carboxy-muconic semialdehyde decarboxylase